MTDTLDITNQSNLDMKRERGVTPRIEGDTPMGGTLREPVILAFFLPLFNTGGVDLGKEFALDEEGVLGS